MVMMMDAKVFFSCCFCIQLVLLRKREVSDEAEPIVEVDKLFSGSTADAVSPARKTSFASSCLLQTFSKLDGDHQACREMMGLN